MAACHPLCVVLCCLPCYGHAKPLVILAELLVDAGHEVNNCETIGSYTVFHIYDARMIELLDQLCIVGATDTHTGAVVLYVVLCGVETNLFS